MKASIVLLALMIFSLTAFCQPGKASCDCATQFAFVRHEMETNYAGYKDKVNHETASQYMTLTSKYLDKAKNTNKQQYCFQLMKEWLGFFKDGHVQLYAAEVNHDDTIGMAERIKQCEILDLTKATIEGLKNAKGIEGVYIHNDSMYTIAVIKNKTDDRDYAGVIIDSKTPYWKAGQVKLELKKENDSVYRALLYYRDHSYGMQRYTYSGARLNGREWTKINAPQANETGTAHNGFEYHRVFTKKLSDSTFYIQIGTFNTANADAIDSLFKANEKVLKSTPNLILDLRYNGGGADFAFGPIIPYLYTGPMKGIGNDMWATSDNANNLLKYLDDPNLPEDTKTRIKALAERVKQNTGKFIMSAEDDTTTLDKTAPYPKKVAILINQNCASTTEEFLLYARQSSKVILMGEHTYGELDYSNLLNATSPCKEIGLYYSSTKSRRIDRGQGIDNTGVKPNVVLGSDKDWIKEAQLYLEKQK